MISFRSRGLGSRRFVPLLLPVLLRERHQLPAVLGLPEELGVVELLDRRLHLCHGGGHPHPIDEEGGDVRLGAGQVTEELQEADDLGDPQRPALGPRDRP